MAFLVGPGDSVDTDPGTVRILGKSARKLQSVDDAERTVEPAAIGLGLAVRAEQQHPPRAWIAADDVADPIDYRVEPRLAKFFGQPVSRLNVGGRISRPVDAALVAAEFGKPFQIRNNAISIDFRHDLCAPVGDHGDQPEISLKSQIAKTSRGSPPCRIARFPVSRYSAFRSSATNSRRPRRRRIFSRVPISKAMPFSQMRARRLPACCRKHRVLSRRWTARANGRRSALRWR